MSLINEISGPQLLQLATRASQGKVSLSSEITAASTSSARPAASLPTAVQAGVASFARSAQRMNLAFETASSSVDTLTEVHATIDELRKFAETAADPSLSDQDRSSIDVKFQKKLLELSALLAPPSGSTTDPLNTSDLATILEDAGIDLSQPTALANAFKELGGNDGQIGDERIQLQQGEPQEILDQSVSDLSSAQQALEVAKQLSKKVAGELEAYTTIRDELDAANAFAVDGVKAFLKSQSLLVDGSDAQTIASSVVQNIRELAHDGALSAHSDIDASLAADLLGS